MTSPKDVLTREGFEEILTRCLNASFEAGEEEDAGKLDVINETFKREHRALLAHDAALRARAETAERERDEAVKKADGLEVSARDADSDALAVRWRDERIKAQQATADRLRAAIEKVVGLPGTGIADIPRRILNEALEKK